MEINSDQNILLCESSTKINEILFQTALHCGRNGGKTLYIASKPLEKLPIPTTMSIGNKSTTVTVLPSVNKNDNIAVVDSECSKNIIFMYFKSADSLINKLLDLFNWSITPSLIIIESIHTFFPNNISKEELLKKSSLIIAILHNCVKIFSKKMIPTKCFSIISLDPKYFIRNSINHQEHLLILKKLYYYKENSCWDSNYENLNDLLILKGLF